MEFQVARLVAALGLTEKTQVLAAGKSLRGLARIFLEKDCSLAEINPLVRTRDGRILAIDAKMNFDDSGLFRHADIHAMFDPSEENDSELRAKRAELKLRAARGDFE